jgi:hypothetical protein
MKKKLHRISCRNNFISPSFCRSLIIISIFIFGICPSLSSFVHRDTFGDAKMLEKNSYQAGFVSWTNIHPLYHVNDLNSKTGYFGPSINAFPSLVIGGASSFSLTENDEIGVGALVASPFIQELVYGVNFFGPTVFTHINWKRAVKKGNTNVSFKIGTGIDYHPSISLGLPLYGVILAGTDKKRINYTFSATLQNSFRVLGWFGNLFTNNTGLNIANSWSFNNPNGITFITGFDLGYNLSVNFFRGLVSGEAGDNVTLLGVFTVSSRFAIMNRSKLKRYRNEPEINWKE